MSTDLKKKGKTMQIKGTATVMKENLLHSGNPMASVVDRFAECLMDERVSLQLVSFTQIDPLTRRGSIGKPAFLQDWGKLSNIETGKSDLPIVFEWDDNQGIPGAIIVKNNHRYQFFLESITIDDVQGKGRIHFDCHSWIYPKYRYDRIFFANDTYIPSQTPTALWPYREEELYHLKGNGHCHQLKKEDRIYDYACYNDLGKPDNARHYAREVLGGSSEKPYPRRCYTGREPTKIDPNSESRASFEDIYVPHDEQFGYDKSSEFQAYKLKSGLHKVFQKATKKVPSKEEFNSLEETFGLYNSGIKNPNFHVLEGLREKITIKVPSILKELTRNDGSQALTFPEPLLIKEDKLSWKTDELEFARQMLAGVNPVVIERLTEFPPVSKLDPEKFGNQTSKILPEHILPNLEGLTIEKALEQRRLFILDHHDRFMPYLRDINALDGVYVYATRTILFLQDDGTLKPVAIELSLPHPDGWIYGSEGQVHTPSDGPVWQLAKAYVVVNDSAHHQVISH